MAARSQRSKGGSHPGGEKPTKRCSGKASSHRQQAGSHRQAPLAAMAAPTKYGQIDRRLPCGGDRLSLDLPQTGAIVGASPIEGTAMRISAIATGFVLAIATAFVAKADDMSVRRAWDDALNQQCPGEHLTWLAPADLRDALDDYKQQASPQDRRAMDAAEFKRCRNVMAGASCDNQADLVLAQARGDLASIAAMTCAEFAHCDAQSQCVPASFQAPSDTSSAPRSSETAGLSETQWKVVLARGSRGDAGALDTLVAIRAGTDGDRAESIDEAISDALLTNPKEVLSLLSTHRELPPASWYCEDRAIEPDEADVARWTNAAVTSLSHVSDPALAPIRSACLSSLRQTAAAH